ncbi:MAG: DEAD/DEAH box helicase [Flavobacteriaceae bacterium]
MTDFSSLGISPKLLEAVSALGFQSPTEVQQKAIPILLEKQTDIVVLAQTGTGKTAAFGLPMLQQIDTTSKSTQGLVIAPTRELCVQISKELTKYASSIKGLNIVSVYGGASINDQAKQIKKGAQILVATPGRMQDMIRRKYVNISSIGFCILDEADEMLNMGFKEDITNILSHTPSDKQTWLFSATMPKEVARIAREFMDNPLEITVGRKNAASTNIKHEYYLVAGRERYNALKRLSDTHPDIYSIVFCRTKRDTQRVAEKLIEDGYSAGALHGDLSQNQRDLVMKAFRAKQIRTLVATDVAARGIDVDNISHVIHYQLPDEIETYTHRSGRTGRASSSGTSMIILTKGELGKIRTLERIINAKISAQEIPDVNAILSKQLYHFAEKIKSTKVDPDINAYLTDATNIFDAFSKAELIQKLMSVEFNRLNSYYQKQSNSISKIASDKNHSKKDADARYTINIGSRDDYNWKHLKSFLVDFLSLQADDVYHVDVMENHAYFNTAIDKKEYVLAAFDDLALEGRSIHVRLSDKRGQHLQKGDGFSKRRNNSPKSYSKKRRKENTKKSKKRFRKK